MTSDAQRAANLANAAHSTGPRTEPGKCRSSRNALTFGLYTLTDFVRENETEDYTRICTSLWSELTPEGTLEETLATELMSATWRLRRCRMVEAGLLEADLSESETAVLDPMQNPATEKQQKSVDRARAQSHSIFHRCIAALRKLQTERGVRSQAFPDSAPPEGLGLMDVLVISKVKPIEQTAGPAAAPAPTGAGGFGDIDALMALADHQLAQRYREQGLAGFAGAPTPAPTPVPAPTPAPAPAPMASNCKPAAPAPPVNRNFPRNAACPCGSGAKFKRCCGNPAAATLRKAA